MEQNPTCFTPNELQNTHFVMIVYCTGYKKEHLAPRTYWNRVARGSVILFNTARKSRKGVQLLAIMVFWLLGPGALERVENACQLGKA